MSPRIRVFSDSSDTAGGGFSSAIDTGERGGGRNSFEIESRGGGSQSLLLPDNAEEKEEEL